MFNGCVPDRLDTWLHFRNLHFKVFWYQMRCELINLPFTLWLSREISLYRVVIFPDANAFTKKRLFLQFFETTRNGFNQFNAFFSVDTSLVFISYDF